MDDILSKARELGIMISQSGELEKLRIAEERQLNDPKAQKLMMEYAKKKEELSLKASKPDITKEELESVKSEMQSEFEKMCVNENIKAYLEASNDFSNLIGRVNSIIGYFVKGNSEEGCSGNCSGCSGCNG